MKYKNFFVYVQRQIDCFFRLLRKFARVYVNNIVVFFHTKKHKQHFCDVFIVLQNNNVFIKFIKIFFEYSSVSLFEQKIDLLKLFTTKNKLKIIVKLKFFRILRQLKFYLNLID